MPHRPGMRPLEEQVREALDAGITMLQLREKYLSEEDFLREALSIRKLTERYHVPLIINDSLYVAINSGADGIHIGQSDLPAREVRAKLGPDKILGVTAKTVAQALEAEKGAVALANIFAGRQPYFLPKMASKSVTVPMPFYKRSSFIDIPLGMPYFKLFYF